MDATKPLLLRVSEVAEELNVARSTAYQLVATGQLPAVRVGRAVRVSRSTLLEWITRAEAISGDRETFRNESGGVPHAGTRRLRGR